MKRKMASQARGGRPAALRVKASRRRRVRAQANPCCAVLLPARGLPEGYLRKYDVCQLLRRAPRTINSWMLRRWLPFYKFGNAVFFRWSEIERLLKPAGGTKLLEQSGAGAGDRETHKPSGQGRAESSSSTGNSGAREPRRAGK